MNDKQQKNSELKIDVLGDITFEMIDRVPLPEEYPSIEIGVGDQPGKIDLWNGVLKREDKRLDYDYVAYDQYMGWYRHYRIDKDAKVPIKYLYEGNLRLKVLLECDDLTLSRLSLGDKRLEKGPYKQVLDMTMKIPEELVETLLPIHRSGGRTIEKGGQLWDKVVEVIMPNCQKEIVCQIREEVKNE